ncbi:hypothetical protein ABT121_44350 [Streptomyces sp. NPDC001928]|uniref:hypothetical protein n=1 Tax=Streptomyces sp. NPDC001928 TaxID=3154404 RepID=UPI0033260CDB
MFAVQFEEFLFSDTAVGGTPERVGELLGELVVFGLEGGQRGVTGFAGGACRVLAQLLQFGGDLVALVLSSLVGFLGGVLGLAGGMSVGSLGGGRVGARAADWAGGAVGEIGCEFGSHALGSSAADVDVGLGGLFGFLLRGGQALFGSGDLREVGVAAFSG